MTQLSEEQQRRVKQIKRYSRLSYTVSDDNQVAAGLLRDARTDIDFLLSLYELQLAQNVRLNAIVSAYENQDEEALAEAYEL